MEYTTYDARLATFQPPSKRSKAGWPHTAPTPQALAKAGFYYESSIQSKDNTICFLCSRALDGWEAEDDPVSEHVKHSPDCAWAVLMDLAQHESFEVEKMEDPTNERLMDARRQTFRDLWPHESKRGWVCKTERMVEAGWHLEATTASEDWVSCVYCKLSLDGWEPKDNPFDEHMKRSPMCPFFAFAGSTAPSKRPKAKKGRASKGGRMSKMSTRLSTQSNLTTASEVSSIPDLDESIDTSTGSIMSQMSVMSTASTTTGKNKRKASTKAKATKSKKARTTKAAKSKMTETEQHMETEQTPEIEETSRPKSPTYVSEPEIQDDIEPHGQSTSPAIQLQPMSNTEVKYPALAHNISPSPLPTRTATKSKPAIQHSSPIQISTSIPEPLPQSSPRLPSPPPAQTDASSPAQNSDIENAPPSTLTPSSRPPLSSPNNNNETLPRWTPVDIETIFQITSTPTETVTEPIGNTLKGGLSKDEQDMTVQEWIQYMAEKAEMELQQEAARVVGGFEREGARAMTVLEGIVCTR